MKQFLEILAVASVLAALTLAVASWMSAMLP